MTFDMELAFTLEGSGYSTILDFSSALTSFLQIFSTTTLLVSALQASSPLLSKLQSTSSLESFSAYPDVSYLSTPPPTTEPTMIHLPPTLPQAQAKLYSGVAGAFAGTFALAMVIFFLWRHVQRFKLAEGGEARRQMQEGGEAQAQAQAQGQAWNVDKVNSLLQLVSVAVFFATITSIALVLKWATDGTSTDPMDKGMLGKPQWDTSDAKKVFSWHPVLMVIGLFSCQVAAVLIWNLPHHTIAKAIHATLQTAGLISMYIALAAVVINKRINDSPNLTTIHEWLGCATCALFTVNWMWGAGMATFTQWFPHSVLRRAFNLRDIHAAIGMSAFFFLLGDNRVGYQ